MGLRLEINFKEMSSSFYTISSQSLYEVYSEPAFVLFVNILGGIAAISIIFGWLWSAFLCYPLIQRKLISYCCSSKGFQDISDEKDLFILDESRRQILHSPAARIEDNEEARTPLVP